MFALSHIHIKLRSSVSNNELRVKIKQKCIISLRHTKTKTMMSQSTINPDFFGLIALFLCKNDNTCLDRLVLPPIDRQIEIVYNYRNIQHKVDIEEHEAIVLKSLILGDPEILERVITSIRIIEKEQKRLESLERFVQPLSQIEY